SDVCSSDLGARVRVEGYRSAAVGIRDGLARCGTGVAAGRAGAASQAATCRCTLGPGGMDHRLADALGRSVAIGSGAMMKATPYTILLRFGRAIACVFALLACPLAMSAAYPAGHQV